MLQHDVMRYNADVVVVFSSQAVFFCLLWRVKLIGDGPLLMGSGIG
jgi:hypothetical protein